MKTPDHRALLRRAGGPLLAAVTFLLLVHSVVPEIIRLAYEGRGPAWLEAMMSGRHQHPVQRYLDFWRAIAWKLDGLALIALLLFLVRRPLQRVWTRFIHAEPGLGAGSLLSIAAAFGMATGMLQGLHVFLRKFIQPLSQATLDQSYAALWMSPIGESLLMVGLGLLLVLVTRAWRKPVSLVLVVTIFAALGTYGFLRSLRLGLGVWPSRLLALGIAVRAGAWARGHAHAFRRSAPWTAMGGLVWVLAMASALYGGGMAREWWVLRGLPAPDDSPNVVLLILDTVRARSLSLYGHEHPTTPHLEELARESVTVNGAVAVTSWTLPSHAAMLTGRFPWEMDVSWSKPMGTEYPTLAEALSSLGYATGGFVANRFYAGREAGVARGFGHWVQAPRSMIMLIRNSWLLNRTLAPFLRARGLEQRTTRDARTISEGFLGWAARQGDRPYFAMLNFMDAHTPYESPDSILSRFATGKPLNNTVVYAKTYTAAELAELHQAYDAAIAYIDQEVGRIVDTLRARGELDHTLLIVTADHGELLGERDPTQVEHGKSLYAANIVVPLLLRYPGVFPAGLRVRRTVTTERIAATVMDLVGAPDLGFPGRSLATDIRTEPVPSDTAEPAISLLRWNPFATRNDPIRDGPMASAMWTKWQYIRDGRGREELYDRVDGPWETRNVADATEWADVLERLRSAVDREIPAGVIALPAAEKSAAVSPSTTGSLSVPGGR